MIDRGSDNTYKWAAGPETGLVVYTVCPYRCHAGRRLLPLCAGPAAHCCGQSLRVRDSHVVCWIHAVCSNWDIAAAEPNGGSIDGCAVMKPGGSMMPRLFRLDRAVSAQCGPTPRAQRSRCLTLSNTQQQVRERSFNFFARHCAEICRHADLCRAGSSTNGHVTLNGFSHHLSVSSMPS